MHMKMAEPHSFVKVFVSTSSEYAYSNKMFVKVSVLRWMDGVGWREGLMRSGFLTTKVREWPLVALPLTL